MARIGIQPDQLEDVAVRILEGAVVEEAHVDRRPDIGLASRAGGSRSE